MTKKTNSDLQSKIEAWLNKQGYPLEMQTAQAFISRQFDTRQSEFYIDCDSGETRETDVVARKDIVIQNLMLRLSIVIECKAATDKPWILFSTGKDQLPDATRVFQRPASRAGMKALQVLMRNASVCNAPLFAMDANSGYGLVQALRDENPDRSDVAYRALVSVTHAACSMALGSDRIDQQAKRIVGVNAKYAHVLFPTLVIGGPLWRCTLNKGDTAKVEVKQIESGVLAWKNPIFGHAHTLIHVVTKKHLDAYADGAAATYATMKAVSEGVAKSELERVPASFAERKRAVHAIKI